jgi:Peptidase M50B-like
MRNQRTAVAHAIDQALVTAGLVCVVAGASLVAAANIPGMRLGHLAHELGHAATGAVAGYDVAGVTLDPRGFAATFASSDVLAGQGLRGMGLGTMVLSAGILSEAALAAGLLVAVRKMRTGRGILLGIAAVLVATAFFWVPDDAHLPVDGSVSADAGTFTLEYALLFSLALVLVAVPGGAVSRAAAYTLAAMTLAGLASSLRELWFPSQPRTDARLAASLTSIPIDVWRIGWTIAAVLLVMRPLLSLMRSPNGWPLQRVLPVHQPLHLARH